MSAPTISALSAADFEPIAASRPVHAIVRPSLSYWQDAWRRLRANPRAMVSLAVVVLLLAFTLVGPLLWPVDAAQQDLDQISAPPGFGARARVVAEFEPMPPMTQPMPATAAPAVARDLPAPQGLAPIGDPTTQVVRLRFDAVPGATTYRVYRNLFAPQSATDLGLPLGELPGRTLSFEDRLDLEPRTWYYSVVATDGTDEAPAAATVRVDVERVITASEAAARGLEAPPGSSIVTLPAHPLGTDYLGRDLLARAIHGARVSLFIGIVAPLLFVLFGIAYGAVAGLLGGWVDAVLMRFADFVVALPFLLFMILFRIAFGIGPGESGIVPLLIALIALGWPSTTRLVRGQVLQLREEGYVQAARLMGAPTWYLVLRHMLPNTLGVVLVTLTFAVPSAIFTEAFLSFIGMGVAPPTPSWGSMCNEGLKTMLTSPHELLVPALLISATVLAFNLLGDGLRDALDARMRSRE